MPIHDWTRVDVGLFHHFHQCWTVALNDNLNARSLPRDYFALIEQRNRAIPDFVTLDLSQIPEETDCLQTTAPPQAQFIRRIESEAEIYADKASRITVRHRHGNVVAVVEIVSPGNKASQAEFRAFVEKSADLILQHVHLLVIDLFPFGKRDPHGIHQAIWGQFVEEELEPPSDKPLTLASYDAGDLRGAYVNFAAVGEPLPDMPLFLKPETYVLAPLEATYQTTWEHFPAPLKGLLEGPEPH